MNSFDLHALFTPSLVIFFIYTIFVWWETKSHALALGLSAIKALFFLIYFSLIFNDGRTLIDDIDYFYGGQELNSIGVNAFNIFENLEDLLRLGEGWHFGYYVYNLIAFNIFGEYYFSPVSLNVIAMLPVASMGARIAVRGGLINEGHKIPFFVFILLSPEIVAWSSTLNLKDPLILLAHVVFIYSIQNLLYGNRKYFLIYFSAGMIIALFIRVYIPIFFIAALFLVVINKNFKIATISLVLVLLVFHLSPLSIDYVIFALNLLRENFVNPAYGIPRFLLTPVPFGASAEYAFLVLPSIINWILFPFLIYGFFAIYLSRNVLGKFLIIYFILFCILYGTFDQLQGPRHRLQLAYVIILFQFVGLVAFVKKVSKATRKSPIKECMTN